MKTIQQNGNPMNYIPRRGESHSPQITFAQIKFNTIEFNTKIFPK